MIHSIETKIQPRIGKAISLGRGHVDAASLSVVLHYQELGQSGGAWAAIQKQAVLVENTHFILDSARGQITLLNHALFNQLGKWHVGDREEELLYKNAVKAPQSIVVGFDHYAPAEVTIVADKAQVFEGLLALTVTSESGDDVPVAIYSGESKVGTVTVPVVDGEGQHVMAVGAGVPAGRYRFIADYEALDPVWQLPTHGSEPVEVEVLDG